MANTSIVYAIADTLIVWTEPDGVDYALSFQDPEGCSEVWNFILDVQRHMNSNGTCTLIISLDHSQCLFFFLTADDQTVLGSSSPLIGPNESITTASIIRSGHLPLRGWGSLGRSRRLSRVGTDTDCQGEDLRVYSTGGEFTRSALV
jgi:protein phosphatase-4 regulatory subunit 3